MKIIAAQTPDAAKLRALLKRATVHIPTRFGEIPVAISRSCPPDTVFVLADPPETP